MYFGDIVKDIFITRDVDISPCIRIVENSIGENAKMMPQRFAEF